MEHMRKWTVELALNPWVYLIAGKHKPYLESVKRTLAELLRCCGCIEVELT